LGLFFNNPRVDKTEGKDLRSLVLFQVPPESVKSPNVIEQMKEAGIGSHCATIYPTSLCHSIHH
jgi:hypothetical protein